MIQTTSHNQSRFRQTLIILASLISIAYVVYRGLFTLNLATPWATFASLFLYIGEVYGLIVLLLFFLQVWDPFEPPEQPVLDGVTVDVFVPTYNEDPAMLRATLEACIRMDYPHNTYVCDDGKRPAMAELAKELGVHYIIRPDNRHAKAGNLNHAFEKTNGEFIIIFDADHVPEPNFITRTLGYFRDPKMAWVQTPHAFYNFESFQARLDHKARKYWDEGALFYKVIQTGRNRWNCPIFAGSAAIFRREALRQVGYIAVETITEDMHTGLRMHALGWKSLAISDRLVCGQAAPDITTFHTQRLRWGEGNLSIMAYDNPMTTRGLTWSQRFCYLGSMLNWAGGLFKLPIYLTPIFMLFTGVPPVNQFSWTLVIITFLYMVISLWGLKAAGNGHASIINSELFCMVNFWTQVRGVSRATFWRKFQQFVVTSKRGRQAKSIWPYIRPQLILGLLSIMALVWGWGRPIIGISDDWFKPVLPTIWVVLHGLLIYLTLKRAFWPEDRRFNSRHVVHLPVEYRLLHEDPNPNHRFGVTLDLNENGMALIAYEVIPQGTRLRTVIRGAGVELVCESEVRGVVPLNRRVSGTMHGYRYGCLFHNLSPNDIDALNRICLHYAVPRMYEVYDRGNASNWLNRMLNWRQRGMVQRRTAFRYPYNLPVIIEKPMAANRTQSVAAIKTPAAGLPRVYDQSDSGLADVGGDFLDSTELRLQQAGALTASGSHSSSSGTVRTSNSGTITSEPAGSSGATAQEMLQSGTGAFRSSISLSGANRTDGLQAAQRIYSATEDLSRVAFACLLDEPLIPGSVVNYVLPSPLGEVKGTAKVLFGSKVIYAAREYHRIVFEFKDFTASGRTTLQSLVNPRENTSYGSVLSPDRQPLPVKMFNRIAMGAMLTVPVLAAQQLAFYLIYREEFYLRDIVRTPADMDLSEDQVERVETIYAATFLEKYPSTDRLVLLMSALNRIQRTQEIDEITKLIAPRDRRNTDLQIALAQALDDTQEYAQAEVEFQRMLDLSRRGLLPAEKQRELRLAAARSSVHAKKYTQAFEQFRELLKENPLDMALRNEFAGVLVTARQLQEARQLYTDIDPDFDGRIRLISIYSLEQNYEQAEIECRRLLQMRPGDRKAEQMLADVLSAKKGYGQSRAIYERLIAADPKNPTLRIKLARNALAAKQYETAMTQLQQLFDDNPNPNTELVHAYVDAAASVEDRLLDEKIRKTALSIYNKIITQSDIEPWFLARLSWVLQRVKELEPSLVLIERALQMNPKDADFRKQYFGVLVSVGKIEDALNLLGDENSMEARKLIIAMYLRDQKYDEAEKECRRVLDAEPGDGKTRRLLADILSWKGDYGPALTMFADMIQAAPEDLELQVRQAEILLWSKDFTRSVAAFEKLLLKKPDDPPLVQGFIDAAAGVKELTETQSQLARRIADKRLANMTLKLNAVSLSRLAWILLLSEQKNTPDRVRINGLLDRALALKPTEPEIRSEMAGVLARADRFPDAIKLIETDKLDTDGMIRLAEFYSGAKDFDKAEVTMRKVLEKEPNNRKAQFFLADVASWRRNFSESLEQFQRLLQIYPEDPEIPIRIAEVILWSGESDRTAFDRALLRFQTMLEANPTETPNPRLISGWVSSASSARALTPGNEKMARKLFDIVMLTNNKDAGMLSRLGWVMYRLKETGKSEMLIDRALALKPTDPQQRRELAGTLSLLKRYSEAITLYDGLKLDMNDRRQLIGMASAAQDYELAARLARQQLLDRPDDKIAQRQLADVLSWKKDYDESLSLFQELLESQPTNEDILLRIAEVNLWSRHYPESLKVFESLLRESLDRAELYEGFIDAASSTTSLSASQTQMAKDVADRVLEEDFNDPGRLSRLSWVLLKANDKKRATELLNRAMKQTIVEEDIRRELAGTLAGNERFTEALAMFDGIKALTLADRQTMANLYSAIFKFEEAEKQLRIILKEKPSDKVVRLQLADVLTWSKKYAEAIELYESLQEEDPRNVKIAFKLTQCYLWSGDHPTALARLPVLMETESDNPEFWKVFIDTIAAVGEDELSTEVRRNVQTIYTRSVKQIKDPDYLARMGYIMGRIGERDKSMELFRTALKLKPDSRQIRLQIAESLYAQGKYEEAEQYFKELIEKPKPVPPSRFKTPPREPKLPD
ncbi:tetratricopeptide repeat protein [Tuwongella immobilis]|uniref:Cellulose synthase (UDP-forming) n=1 Tax=Tuwongella immobilis TaxID=692036 RepID=A0A6C2YHE3_9BACT|nr:tetratricopeptide repeat protein [Tuwongella immobilis]VIP00671.1 cellulose synthase : Cellulose synthase (UDP-forming) OS=Blastopirellula marina DSM 3645 GN=DSM3645_10227 PE=4 SV=1: Glyco_tranf_2_3: PilZ: TPR_8: TPR_19: TPR_11 [Tuwongella immobilis]VTR96760.1 cellulose synthase : Cellulose synthase (UDP-forming) OS=Blastopirellula marina DSM 3645 GN=DSM3645_10227 PE=4 SV=1: Glyco_tranf_2_3: PilZ: TPR_8: TPR_19: TPR_11 [Tuwongella immobilis]